MSDANLAQIKQAIATLENLLYWHGRDPIKEVDACLEAQNAIDDLVQSDAIRKLKTAALERRKTEFLEKRGDANG